MSFFRFLWGQLGKRAFLFDKSIHGGGAAVLCTVLRAIFFLLLTFYFLLFLAIFSTMCYYVSVRNPIA